MRISFSTPVAAHAAVSILEQYGFCAHQFDRDVITSCPTLLSAPAIERSIGLELVEEIDTSDAGGHPVPPGRRPPLPTRVGR